ncbi:MAG: dihydroorotase, partial [Bacteroidetes bacterium]
MTDRLSIRRPDDWHLHLRDGDLLAAVLPATTAVMGRALVMPNLVPPVVTTAQAAAYRARIRALLPPGSSFEPLMAAYLTEDTDPVDIERGFRDGVLFAVKLYPAGATTHSAAGVRSLSAVRRVLERLEAIGMPLLVHGEVTDPVVDIFDREAVFIDRHLGPLLEEHPGLRVVLEHVTTREGVDFVQAHGGRVGATVTPQHLLANRNDLLVGGVRPHLYCLPVLKRASHQRALREAVCSGDPSFFLGTDSAPHLVVHKESACGCAGCFTAPAALPLYAEVFEDEGALDRLEGFTSVNGPTFYGLPVSTERVTLVREEGRVPHRVAVAGGGELRPFMAGRRLRWT